MAITHLNRRIATTFFFSIAMAYLESAVVVYLRELYYKTGFEFPLHVIPPHTAVVEMGREVATIAMLVTVAMLAGRRRKQTLEYFMFSFAVWDLFYYVFLYVLLQWPPSLNTWDILFLIPVPWTGPVWAPCLIDLLLIAAALLFIRRKEQFPGFEIPRQSKLTALAGIMLCLSSFMYDFFKARTSSFDPAHFADLGNYVPQYFNLPLFFSGFALMTISLFTATKKQENENK
jgi:hypothetical protein